ncbi:hypothetical protein Tco_0824938 [Tanacetum coccineum]
MYKYAGAVHKKTLILGDALDTPSMLQVKELIKLSDGIIFDSVVNLNNIVPTMYCESLDDLTTIMLSDCHNLLSLVDSSDWDVDDELGGKNAKKQFFRSWNTIKLERLFSVNAARGLVNLQTLKIEACDNLKELIWDGDGGDNDMIVFRCLVKIELRYLDELKSFYAGKVKISYPSLEKVEIYGCNIMDKWGYNGTYDTPNLKLVNQAIADSKFLPFVAYACVSYT